MDIFPPSWNYSMVIRNQLDIHEYFNLWHLFNSYYYKSNGSQTCFADRTRRERKSTFSACSEFTSSTDIQIHRGNKSRGHQIPIYLKSMLMVFVPIFIVIGLLGMHKLWIWFSAQKRSSNRRFSKILLCDVRSRWFYWYFK